MKHVQSVQTLLQVLPPKQKSRNFEGTTPWSSLSTEDRQACREAIAGLLRQVAITHGTSTTREFNQQSHNNQQSPNKETRS